MRGRDEDAREKSFMESTLVLTRPQSCSVLNNTVVIASKFINKFVQKCQCYYTFLEQSNPLVAVTSVVSLLTEQLCLTTLWLELPVKPS